MKHVKYLPIITLLTSQMAFSAQATGPDVKSMQDRWNTVLNGEKITSVEQGPMDGLYEVSAGSHIFYTDTTGQKLFLGDIIQSNGSNQPTNLTEEERQKVRVTTLKSIPAAGMITYKAKDPKHAIYVFTDSDCGYCRKFHEERQELLDNGITINYLAMPRTPEGTPSYNKAVAIWCAKDPNAALTEAKDDKFKFDDATINDKQCDNAKKFVADEVKLARQLGAQGTPTILLENGELIPGYIPAKELIAFYKLNPTK